MADRFPLVKNLSQDQSYRSELKAAEQSQHQATLTDIPDATVLAVPYPTATEQSQQQIRQNQQRKIEQQQTIKSLRAQGFSQTAIAQKLGISPKTAERYSSLPDFPEIPARRATFGRSLLAPYKPQLLD